MNTADKGDAALQQFGENAAALLLAQVTAGAYSADDWEIDGPAWVPGYEMFMTFFRLRVGDTDVELWRTDGGRHAVAMLQVRRGDQMLGQVYENSRGAVLCQLVDAVADLVKPAVARERSAALDELRTRDVSGSDLG